ncbi:MAG: chromosome partitioning protein ParB [Candidatus Thiodiazotropha sp. (ex. Lucinisca nassula)]|nr:chromosome partitioning protein ParB [Candidatus Thiodiazotropha sp. (ex. Lucinisca nassula)]MBW9273673.1 chromosome partitioning protein ParB [Candidatus Thiodiazotropha sp. (ex. Lucinisca nassula)]PUB82589.1 MAG: chromosome partitioning protein ParB [gamma proteobacterium symbiont of Ctena orbiculata]
MSYFIKKTILNIVVISLLIFHPAAHAAKQCKGLSKSSCNTSGNCTWVNSYKTKTGTKVGAYCRTKSGKKTMATEKQKKKTKAVKEKKSKKSKKDKKDSKKSKDKKKQKSSK